jgi:predicted N-formylglutamate amidohydrolase
VTHKNELLAPDEANPVKIENRSARSMFLLTGDHAGVAIPRALDGLGLDRAELNRHIAIDIGIESLGIALSSRLGATFARQHYSRLVIDCNRDPARADAMPEISDGTRVPPNQGLTPEQRAARVAAIHAPYHDAIEALLAERAHAGLETILVALHSFTPVMGGLARPWHVGVLHDGGDTRFAQALLQSLAQDQTLVVGDNEPYRMDTIDYSVPRHAYPARLAYAEIEIRQDLLGDPAGIEAWADRLARMLPDARSRLSA